MLSRVSNKYIHPVSDVSRNGFFLSDGPNSGKKNVSRNSRIWSAKLNEIHDRLFTHHTINSIRRGYHHVIEDKVPNDALDFALSSIYIHSEDYNVPKNYVSMQPDTINIPMWIVQQHEFRDITSLVSTTTEGMNKQGKWTGPVKKKVNEPRIAIGTSSLPLKKQTNKYGKAFPTMKNYKNVSEQQKEPGKMAPRQRYDNITSRKHNDKSSSSKRTPLSSNKKYSKTPLTSTTRGHGQSSSRNRYTVGERDAKSARKTSKRSRQTRNDAAEDEIVDKTQRRESYAAQMRAIERIHPSSLKLAVDGPHSDQTNPGYSRKIDGTFYGI